MERYQVNIFETQCNIYNTSFSSYLPPDDLCLILKVFPLIQLYIVACNNIKIIFTVAFLKITSFLGDSICYHSFELSDISPKLVLDMRKKKLALYMLLLYLHVLHYFL